MYQYFIIFIPIYKLTNTGLSCTHRQYINYNIYNRSVMKELNQTSYCSNTELL